MRDCANEAVYDQYRYVRMLGVSLTLAIERAQFVFAGKCLKMRMKTRVSLASLVEETLVFL